MTVRKFKNFVSEHGFTFDRMGKGSHEIWKNAEGATFTIPVACREVHKGIEWNFKRNYCK